MAVKLVPIVNNFIAKYFLRSKCNEQFSRESDKKCSWGSRFQKKIKFQFFGKKMRLLSVKADIMKSKSTQFSMLVDFVFKFSNFDQKFVTRDYLLNNTKNSFELSWQLTLL